MVQADQSLSGIAIYSFFDTGGNSVNQVGAPFSLDFSSMSIFADLGADIYTGIALANPNSVAATVTLTLRDQQSSVIGTTQFDLPANGHLAKYLPQIFVFIYRTDFQGTLDIVSTQTLASLTLRQRNLSFTSLPVIP